MGAIAIQAALAVGYVNAGTVEFLMDRDRNYYFLEMNTRLQVEHPVTEMVTGVDIVKEQLAIASGRKMRYQQKDVRQDGWAIECRISAEDPYNNFLPSSGRITSLYEPTGPGVRVESGVYEGFEVSLYYDPLIAKLVVWGESRAEAILRMRRALQEFRIGGIKTTIPFHQQIMDTATFQGGHFDTMYLEQKVNVIPNGASNQAHRRVAAIAAALVAHQHSQEAWTLGGQNHRSRQDGAAWRRAGREIALRGS
jgi:acetyl-CoA carboxylase, biotin carboxylase subunit